MSRSDLWVVDNGESPEHGCQRTTTSGAAVDVVDLST